ncbi:CHAT domain-containing protein [Sinosporangium siamense]|uniref:CHAT domain-containing protein n=1 Tax=Sinosporangium siamense TaxID=1367973 RepID=UPI0019503923|nr:CHAT domain-containing protein [Sinosporangium siamense]
MSLRDVFAIALAEQLLKGRRPFNVREALHLYGELGGLRETAPLNWAEVQHNIGMAYRLLARPGSVEDLVPAKEALERALTVRTPQADPEGWAVTVVSLAEFSLEAPAHDTRRVGEGVRLLKKALREAPPGLPAQYLARFRSALGLALLRGADGSTGQDLNRAIDLLRSVASTPAMEEDPDLRRTVWINLGTALSKRAEQLGDPADWDSAITVLRMVSAEISADLEPRYWVAANGNLGIALLHRVGADHDADLAEAIEVFRAVSALSARSRLQEEFAASQNNLGNALRARLAGDRDEDLSEAAEAYRSALKIWTEPTHPVEWALTNARLADTRSAQGAYAEAVELFSGSLRVLDRERHPFDWAGVANRQAAAEEHLERGDGHGLRTAIALYEKAVRTLGPGRFTHLSASIQSNLGDAHLRMAQLTGSPVHAVRAVESFREALRLCPVEEAPLEWAQSATGLGLCLAEHGRSTEAVQWMRKALQVLETGGLTSHVLHTAEALGHVLSRFHRWNEARTAFHTALVAAERRLATAILRKSKEKVLSDLGRLSIIAAYITVKAGYPAEAVDLLEAGRARLLADALEREDPVWAETTPQSEAYRAATLRLAEAEAASARLLRGAPPGEERFLRRAEQSVRAELREASAAFEAARAATADTSSKTPRQRRNEIVIYLLASYIESIGLVETPDGAVTVIRSEIPTLAELEKAVRGADGHPGITEARGEALEALLRGMGGIAERISRTLTALGASSVTLVPCGPFAALPIHAFSFAASDGERCLLDDFDVGYAPSTTVLDAAYRAGERAVRPFAVGIADEHSGLRHTGQEVAELLSRMPGQVMPEGIEVPEVLALIADATHIHFACHGRSIADRPVDSFLALDNRVRLTVLDLLTAGPGTSSSTRLTAGPLIVASACETAVADTHHTPEEFVGLAAGFLAAGARGFIGTQWPSGDLTSALLMTYFYEQLLPGADGSPVPARTALCRAQRWLRSLTGAELAAYAAARPRLAANLGESLELARGYPEHRFFAKAQAWAPFVYIGAPL